MFKDLGLKFIAIFLAIIFWGGVIILKNNIKTFKEPIPIKPFNVAENLTLSQALESVIVKVETSQETYNELSLNDFEAYIDLKGLIGGEHSVSVQVTSKNPKVKVVKFDPDHLTVNLEEITSKNVSVSVKINGNASANFEAQEPVFELETAVVKGPKNLIDTVTEVKAVYKLKGVEMANVKTELGLFAYNELQNQVNGVTILPPSVEVMIPVIQIQKSKTVGIRANILGNLSENGLFVKKILVSPSTVVIQGNTRDLKEIDYLNTEPIDIEGLDHDTLKRVKLDLPRNIQSPDLTTVLVTIEIGSNN